MTLDTLEPAKAKGALPANAKLFRDRDSGALFRVQVSREVVIPHAFTFADGSKPPPAVEAFDITVTELDSDGRARRDGNGAPILGIDRQTIDESDRTRDGFDYEDTINRCVAAICAGLNRRRVVEAAALSFYDSWSIGPPRQPADPVLNSPPPVFLTPRREMVEGDL